MSAQTQTMEPSPSQTIRITTTVTPEAKRRAELKPFGLASGGNEGVTMRSREEVVIEPPGGRSDTTDSILAQLTMFRRRTRPPVAPPTQSGKYVPPQRRAEHRGTAYSEPQLRLTNLHPDATVADVRELASIWRPTRVAVPRPGLAFLTFASSDDRDAAKARLDGYAYGSLLLSADRPRPRA